LLLCWLATAPAVEPQSFDHWLLALSWSPQHCAERAATSDEQCGTRRQALDFVVHGLWPQRDSGPRIRCAGAALLPRGLIDRMLPLMPSRGLIQHQWNRHGVCTGWPADRYFTAVEQARARIRVPAAYVQPAVYLSTTVEEIEQRFAEANPGFDRDGIAVQCRKRYLREVRLCLTREFRPRSCSADVRDACGAQVVLRPAR
jgi:ribonuclease T2